MVLNKAIFTTNLCCNVQKLIFRVNKPTQSFHSQHIKDIDGQSLDNSILLEGVSIVSLVFISFMYSIVLKLEQ